jgi:hypothetical protein
MLVGIMADPRPGIGVKPSSIGVRQIMVTVVFAALMIAAYGL